MNFSRLLPRRFRYERGRGEVGGVRDEVKMSNCSDVANSSMNISIQALNLTYLESSSRTVSQPKLIDSVKKYMYLNVLICSLYFFMLFHVKLL